MSDSSGPLIERTMVEDEATVVEGASETDDGGKRPLAAVGSMLGRYVIVEEVGAGGMGLVMRAYDPKLHREVALKLLQIHNDPEAELRMVREAQAMAQVSHPNIVAVYDVDEKAKPPYIAMEYVEGTTLSAWLKANKRSWQDVVAAFVEAGHGLVAAHGAGLIHRDFKPGNVLRSTTGRIQVMDFGLARALAGGPSSNDGSSSTGLNEEITAVGTVMGTPAYMAPEQHQGANADARCDQYAFAISLWEGLYGKRPFTGRSREELYEAKLGGNPQARGSDRSVPKRFEPILRRMLDPDPVERFSSMAQALEELERDPSRTQRRVLIAAGVAAAAAAAVGVRQYNEVQQVAACTREGATIDATWNDAGRATVRGALEQTGVRFAPETWARVAPAVDEYASRWSELAQGVCLRRTGRGEADPLPSLATECLAERKVALQALVRVLESADVGTVRHAVELVSTLPPLDRCEDEGWLLQRVRPPADEASRAASDEARELIASARAYRRAGNYDEALELARRAVTRAETSGWDPVIAEALAGRGAALEVSGKYDEAAETLEEALVRAGRSGHDEVAADVMSQLVEVEYDRARPDDALRWGRLAEMMLDRIGEVDTLRRAQLLLQIGQVHFNRSAPEVALEHHQRALDLQIDVLGSEHPSVLITRGNIAQIRLLQGNYEDALEGMEATLATNERVLGPEHPEIGIEYSVRGTILNRLGRYEEAAASLDKALEILRGSLSADHPDVATALNNQAAIAFARGNYDQAAEAFDEAAEILHDNLGPRHPAYFTALSNLASAQSAGGEHATALEIQQQVLDFRLETYGEDHADVAASLTNVGVELHRLGRTEESRRFHERAAGITQRLSGTDHPSYALSLQHLAVIKREQGEWDAALTDLQRVLSIREKTLGEKHPMLTYGLLEQVKVYRHQQRWDAAVAAAERALAIRESSRGSAAELGHARFVLARTLWDADRDRNRAVILARDAMTGLDPKDPNQQAERERIESWLTEHESELQ